MEIVKFALFFIIYFSMFFLGPSVLLKYLTKISRKRKDPTLKKDYIIFAGITVIYLLVFYFMYSEYSNIIKVLGASTKTLYYVNDLFLLGGLAFLFLLVSIIYVIFTFYLNQKLYALKMNEKSYIITSIYAFFVIFTYYIFYTFLGLNMYSFESSHYILNFIYRIDYDFCAYFYIVMVGSSFALSFIKE